MDFSRSITENTTQEQQMWHNEKQKEMAHWYDTSVGVAICKAALKLLLRKAAKASADKQPGAFVQG